MATATLLRKVLHSIPLGRKADPNLKSAIASDDLSAFQESYLAAIAKPVKRLRRQLGRSALLAAWSVNSINLNGRERDLAASLHELSSRNGKRSTGMGKVKEKKTRRSRGLQKYEEVIANWLVEVGTAPGHWENIAIAELLLREGRAFSPESFTQAIAVLADAALRDSSGSLFDVPTESDDGNAISQMIMLGESPWISSLLLRPLGGVQTLAKSASESLRKILLESTDKDGLVHGSLLNQLSDWLAPITRCSIWSDAFREPLWINESQERLALITDRAALLMLPVQQQLYRETDSPRENTLALPDILPFLIPLSGTVQEKRLTKLVNKCRKPAAEVTLPKKPKKQKTKNDDGKVSSGENKKTNRSSTEELNKQKKEANRKAFAKTASPAVSWQSDPNCLAILRSTAAADADTITLEWHSSIPQVMISAAGVPIFSGNWNWSVQLDDEELPRPTAWKCSCWFLDPETVFVELESEDTSVVRQMRQILLAPYDRFAIMTDTVTCNDPERRIQLTTSIPLVAGAESGTCDVTRELTLSVGSRRVRTFPLWLEDDRIHHSLGSYQEHDGQVELAGVGNGGVTLPLALDWHPKRTNVPADWARCTVTEARRIVGTHEASGFRIRIGAHQVLVYRSLQTPAVSRAVLGLHTWDESVYGRVPLKGGLLEPLVEVEYPE